MLHVLLLHYRGLLSKINCRKVKGAIENNAKMLVQIGIVRFVFASIFFHLLHIIIYIIINNRRKHN